MKYPYEFAEFEQKKSFTNHDMISCHDTCNDLCHESLHSLTCHDSDVKLSKDNWWYLVQQLEKWRVFNPRAIITKYGPLNAWEAMLRTKDNHPRVPGAYFTKVVRSLVA